MMNSPSHDPSVNEEPQRRHGSFTPDPSEEVAARVLKQATQRESTADRVDHSVWDEPALAGTPPQDELTYERWLVTGRAQTSAARSWTITSLASAAAGPLAILGTMATGLAGGDVSAIGLAALSVVTPVTEELMKVALALWVVEKRPFLFRSSPQIALCALAGGLIFAAVENVLYLKVYVPDPSSALVWWRWTVCVALHTGCSLIAGMGLIRVWSHTMKLRVRPQLALGVPHLVTAMVIHGVYNSLALLLAELHFQF
jgi:hypothetical protein